MFLMNVTKIFKIFRKLTVVKSFFSKVKGEISAFYNSLENSVRCISMFRKVALLDIFRKFILTIVAGLRSIGCDATKNELLTKFLEGIRY